MALAQHILVPVDFSQASELATGAAKVLAEQNQARLTLVHVFDPMPLAPIATTGWSLFNLPSSSPCRFTYH